jgi:F-type H+-transporting ATPase subunit epsilon
MNEKEFKLEIITPQKIVYSEDVVSVTAPGTEGYLGILANHAALLTSLKPGKIDIRKAGDLIPATVMVQSGFLETSNNKVVILVDKAEIVD